MDINSCSKIVIYIKDVIKPIVLSCSENESSNIQVVSQKLSDFLTGKTKCLKMDSGDIFVCPKVEDIKSILITKEK